MSPVKKFNANVVVFGSKHPYVVRTSQNNGVRAYLDEDEKYLNEANTISFGQDTATMFYQEKPYFTGDKIKVMKYKYGELTSLISCYLLASMGRSFSLFSWGTSSFNENVLNGVLVKVPTIASSLDIDYMEQYISLLEKEKMLQVDKFLKDSGLNDTTLTAEETAALERFRKGEVKFEERKIEELFSCKTGDVDVQRCHLNGRGTIYINSGVTDLGIIGKTDMKARVFPANTITVDMFGNAYYRDFEYKMATHAHVFSLSHLYDKLNKENGLYICAALKYFTQLFSFNNMCNWSKMKEKEVCLPIAESDEIDYDFMQHFISAQEKLAIRGVVKFKNEMLNTTETESLTMVAEPQQTYGIRTSHV